MSEIISLQSRKAEDARAARRREMLRNALPPSDTKRWVASRKAAVVAAVNGGALEEDDARRIYGLSAEELDSWRETLDQHGVNGLRTTRVQDYRRG